MGDSVGRLVAFGCSLTYGDCLPDCYNPDENDPLGYVASPAPSTGAWPRVAADLLGMGCLNLSRSGSSNTRILLSVLGHDWRDGDVAAVLWSYPDRDVLFTEKGPKHLGGWNADSPGVARSYYTAHSSEDLQMRTWIHHHHAALYLESLGVPFVMGSVTGWVRLWWAGRDYRSIDSGVFAQPFIDLGLDGWHPGAEQHREWASVFARQISNARRA